MLSLKGKENLHLNQNGLWVQSIEFGLEHRMIPLHSYVTKSTLHQVSAFPPHRMTHHSWQS